MMRFSWRDIYESHSLNLNIRVRSADREPRFNSSKDYIYYISKRENAFLKNNKYNIYVHEKQEQTMNYTRCRRANKKPHDIALDGRGARLTVSKPRFTSEPALPTLKLACQRVVKTFVLALSESKRKRLEMPAHVIYAGETIWHFR